LGLTEEETKRYRARVIPAGSVVMSCIGRFGLAAVLGTSAVVNQQLHAFLVPHWLPSRFFAYALQAQRQYMEHISTSTTISYLNKDNCNSVPIPLPPLAEQYRIVGELEKRLSIVDGLEDYLDVQISRSDRLRQSILKHAFEGKLVAQDPNDEPASALLERIRAERAAPRTERRADAGV
jgi:type I restriction enzyme S subunit